MSKQIVNKVGISRLARSMDHRLLPEVCIITLSFVCFYLSLAGSYFCIHSLFTKY